MMMTLQEKLSFSIVPVSLSSQIFRQDGRFATHPPLDGGSEAAWDSLIPSKASEYSVTIT